MTDYTKLQIVHVNDNCSFLLNDGIIYDVPDPVWHYIGNKSNTVKPIVLEKLNALAQFNRNMVEMSWFDKPIYLHRNVVAAICNKYNKNTFVLDGNELYHTLEAVGKKQATLEIVNNNHFKGVIVLEQSNAFSNWADAVIMQQTYDYPSLSTNSTPFEYMCLSSPLQGTKYIAKVNKSFVRVKIVAHFNGSLEVALSVQ